MNELFTRRKFINLYAEIPWLTQETRDAIIAAFGAEDGKMVVRATNEYLVQVMKDSGKEKAIALAGFINEDPMMVCSLGLEPQGVTMPIRWLVGNGASYILLNIYATGTRQVRTKVKFTTANTGGYFFGADDAQNVKSFVMGNGLWCLRYNSSVMENSLFTAGVHLMYMNKNVTYVDNAIFYTFTASEFTGSSRFAVMGKTRNNAINGAASENVAMNFLEVVDANIYLVPFISQTRDGMLDLVNMEFYPNQGTGHFTDAYTLPDDTPWTPANDQ